MATKTKSPAPVFTGSYVPSAEADGLAGSILDGAGVRSDFVLAQPSGHYGRVIVGRKASSWLIPRKDGSVRLILRCAGAKPDTKLMDAVRPCDGVDLQLTVTSQRISQAVALVKWAQGLQRDMQKDLEAAREAKVEAAKAKQEKASEAAVETPAEEVEATA